MKRQSWQLKRFLRPRQYIDAQGRLVIEHVNNSGVRVTSYVVMPGCKPGSK